jgi:hypothetical protein
VLDECPASFISGSSLGLVHDFWIAKLTGQPPLAAGFYRWPALLVDAWAVLEREWAQWRRQSTMSKRTAHPGFKAVARAIARRQGISIQAASRILAKKTRQASPAAKARNPRLLRVR